jgi:hypothetical protein
MEDFPVMNQRVRLPLNIRIEPYMRDHRFQGLTVFPAAETLNILARSVQVYRPESPIQYMVQASFPRFLHIGPEDNRIEAFHELETRKNGDIVSRLLTMSVSRNGLIGRAKEHAMIRFKREIPDIPILPFYRATRLEGEGFNITADRLYRELVPFGPSYHNVKEDTLFLTEAGAVAQLSSGFIRRASGILGSPFPMDAALHCACAWGQRFSGVVAFPVGFEERFIFRPTLTGETYFGRIIPIQTHAQPLIFDLWIYDFDGAPREAILGVAMKDVTAGKMKPPDWVRA